MPMTSAAFIIFTLYMIPDPATTPLKPARQALFSFSAAIVYATLQLFHKVFGLFLALLIVCAIRGLSLHAWALWRQFHGVRRRQTVTRTCHSAFTGWFGHILARTLSPITGSGGV